MNIFVLDRDPSIAAVSHCDRHVVKMIVETAQMMSTAHRMLDGDMYIVSIPGRDQRQREMRFTGEKEATLCRVSHEAHPCSRWVRRTEANYDWTYLLLCGLLDEYTHRYGRIHATARLMPYLSEPPENIPPGSMTPHPLCMPDEFKTDDPVESYRRYYVVAKAALLRWTKREAPAWSMSLTDSLT